MFDNLIIKNYIDLENFIKNSNSNINIDSFSKMLINFISELRKSIENVNKKDITWEKPFIKLEYYFEVDVDNAENPVINEKDSIVENIIGKEYFKIFRFLSKEIIVEIERNTRRHILPEKMISEIKKVSLEEQNTLLNEFIKINPFVINIAENKPNLEVFFYPPVFNKDEKINFYSIIISLNCKNLKPSRWVEKNKSNFWEDLLNSVSKDYGKESLMFDFNITNNEISLPNSNIKAIDKQNDLIRTSLHTELQKFGKKPKNNADSIFDLVPAPIDDETKKAINNFKINVVGIDNTQSENLALFAIQRLLSQTNYKGNMEGKQLLNDENSFKFKGYLPFMKFTPAEYLEAYGVKKKQTSRKKLEFNSNERTEAIKALRELSDKKYLLYYERKYWKDGKEVLDIIKTVRPLFNIIEGYEAIDISERDEILSEQAEEKMKFIVIEPCPALVDQIDSYFVLKPANCYQEIRLLVGKTSKHVPLFIDYLRTEVTKREISAKGEEINWNLEINYENLAYKLRMESFILTKQLKRVKQTLDKCYKIATQLGYLISYETIEGKNKTIERLILNPDKFKRVKEIDEKIKKIDLDSDIKFLAK